MCLSIFVMVGIVLGFYESFPAVNKWLERSRKDQPGNVGDDACVAVKNLSQHLLEVRGLNDDAVNDQWLKRVCLFGFHFPNEYRIFERLLVLGCGLQAIRGGVGPRSVLVLVELGIE